MNIYEHIQKSRIFSYVVTGFTLYWTSECLQWVYTMDLGNVSTQGGLIVTATLTALCALLKMTYTFAAYKAPKD
jgi:hypothetical protein